MKKFRIKTEYITLGQFLKATDHIGSGGEAKFFLLENDVLVNQEKRTERGKKLYPGDLIMVEQKEYLIVNDPKNQS
jgi:S4 domain protein YaaA